MQFRKGNYVVNSLVLIDRQNLSPDGAENAVRIALSLDDDVVERRRKLTVRKINLHRWLFIERVLRNVTYHTNDRAPGLGITFAAGKLDSTSKRILIGPQLIGHSLIDQSNFRRLVRVVIRDGPSMLEWNLHRRQISGSHDVKIHTDLVAFRLRMVFNHQSASIEVRA